MRKAADLRQSLEDDKQWIELFFTSLRNCGEQPDLKWFADEIGRIETSCWKSDLSPSQLKAKLFPIADTLPKHLADSREITDAIREKSDSLAKLNESITLASIQQRLQLRIKEGSCHMELNELRERQSELETSIINALQYIDDALHTQILGEKPSTRNPEQELSRSQPPAPEPQPPKPELVTPEIPNLSPSSALSEPEQAAAPKSDPITPEPVLPDQARVYETSPIVPQRPVTPPLEQVTSGPINEHPHPTHHELTTLSDRSPGDLLATLADNPAELTDEEWATLVRLQRGWLERRQPLRAWLLSHAADRPRSSPIESVQALALLPVWACRLLLVLSDAKLPLADEETESLYKIRTLDNDQKELVTLWLTATLLEGTTEKPLRVARLVSPQQFDLAPHSLALCCADYLLTPVFNGGSLRPPKTGVELDRQYQLAIKNAQDILNPSRNNYQKAWVRAFWRKLTSNDGHMGQLLAEAKQGRFPPQTLSPDVIVEGLPEWSEILAAYKRNMTNRIDEFAGLIESARAAYDSAQEALKSDQSKIPKHAVLEILASIQRQPGNGWWLETIRSGISAL